MRNMSTKKRYSDIFNVFFLTKTNKYYYFGSPCALLKMFNIALDLSDEEGLEKQLLNDIKKWHGSSSWVKVECDFSSENEISERTSHIKMKNYHVFDYQQSQLKRIFKIGISQNKGGINYGKQSVN